MRRDQREEALAAIVAADSDWSPCKEVLRFEDVRWRPDLQHTNGTLLHIFFEEIDDAWRKRLKAAHAAGRDTAAAFPYEALSISTLAFLQSIDAAILSLNGELTEEIEIKRCQSVAHLVALDELSLGHKGLRQLCEARLEDALAADTNDKKGRYFEEVLCLLFSQVSFFVVHESRYKNETEEIDLVLGNRGLGAIKDTIGGPVVLASAKNTATAVGAPEVRALWGNMAKRRGRCSLGILCAARTLASTAATERSSSTTDPTLAVALLDGDRIRELLQKSVLDDGMEEVIREAVLY
jgi:hypothetical protein